LKKRIGIIGASGYTGFELIKLLNSRREIELVVLNSETCVGKKVKELYPESNDELTFTNYSFEEIADFSCHLVFLCMDEGYTKMAIEKLNCKIIDLSRDLRFSDGIVYGLPEIYKSKIRSARKVANPGCYATASILGAFPVVKNKLAKQIIFDCKSGYSGAGRKPSYLNNPDNYTDNIIPYEISQHSHRAEIQKYLEFERISFTPHVVPLFRGILCTIHIILNEKIKANDGQSIYKEFYKNQPFIKILDRIPELHNVSNTNLCCIGGFEIDDANRLVVISTLDNLIKGASGQAVQNMNLMLGLKETEGLL